MENGYKWKEEYRIHLRSRSRGRRRRDDDEEEEATTIDKMYSNVFHICFTLQGQFNVIGHGKLGLDPRLFRVVWCFNAM